MADATVYLADDHSSYRRNDLTRGLQCVPGYRDLIASVRHRKARGEKVTRTMIEAAYRWLVSAYDDEPYLR